MSVSEGGVEGGSSNSNSSSNSALRLVTAPQSPSDTSGMSLLRAWWLEAGRTLLRLSGEDSEVEEEEVEMVLEEMEQEEEDKEEEEEDGDDDDDDGTNPIYQTDLEERRKVKEL